MSLAGNVANQTKSADLASPSTLQSMSDQPKIEISAGVAQQLELCKTTLQKKYRTFPDQINAFENRPENRPNWPMTLRLCAVIFVVSEKMISISLEEWTLIKVSRLNVLQKRGIPYGTIGTMINQEMMSDRPH